MVQRNLSGKSTKVALVWKQPAHAFACYVQDMPGRVYLDLISPHFRQAFFLQKCKYFSNGQYD